MSINDIARILDLRSRDLRHDSLLDLRIQNPRRYELVCEVIAQHAVEQALEAQLAE